MKVGVAYNALSREKEHKTNTDSHKQAMANLTDLIANKQGSLETLLRIEDKRARSNPIKPVVKPTNYQAVPSSSW